MLHFLLITFLIGTFAWYLWKKYSPYFSFPNIFFFNWHVISTILRGKGPGNKSINIYLFHLLRESVMKHMSEGATVLWIGRPVLIVYGPELVKFFANERSVFDKTWFYRFFDYGNKDGIFRSSGKRGKQQRKLLAPSFYPRMMKNYVRTMNDHAVCFIRELRQLENHTAPDTLKIMKSKTLKLFWEAAFGVKTSSDAEDSRISTFIKSTTKALQFVNYRGYRPWLHFDFMLHFSSAGRNHKIDVQNMNHGAYQIIEELNERYLNNQSKASNEEDCHSDEQCRKSFGDFLFEEHLKDPSFTLKNLQTEILNLIVGGYDTSSYCLTWTFWLLGFDHDIQEKAYEEVKLLNSEFIDCVQAGNLKYLECIIKESLRIYPVVPVFGRESKKDLYFETHKIPSGTAIIFCPYLLHRHPELYPEPEVFKPDRFLQNESSHFKPWTLIPFAESIRSCIGKNFAMLELKIMLAYVVRNFKIVSLTPKDDVEESFEVMLKSSVPISVKFIPR